MARGRLTDHFGEVAALLRRGKAGLMLDLDGTISEIVPDPEGATVRPSIRGYLAELNRRLALVAIVTGRPARQALGIVGLPELSYVGNHGLERLEKGTLTIAEEARIHGPLLGELIGRLRDRFTGVQGLKFEEKGGSFAVHYRLADDPEATSSEVRRAVDEMAGGRVKVLMGKTVINILPPVELTKGTADASLVKEYGLTGAILIGDDVTDLDLFRGARRASRERDLVNICVAVVGPDSPADLEEEADFTLSSVAQVEAFLGWMVRQTG